jgi:DNA-binding Lrp family transcriptional regulator
MKLDEVDVKILDLLQSNSQLTFKELSTMLNLSISPIVERIKKMEKAGVIDKYVALLNMEHTGASQIIFCHVSLPLYSAGISKFKDMVQASEEVMECHHLAGNIDYQLKIIVKDIPDYDLFLKKLTQIPNLKVKYSSIVLHEDKFTTKLPINIKGK